MSAKRKIAILLAPFLLLAACGTRLTEEEQALYAAGGAAGGAESTASDVATGGPRTAGGSSPTASPTAQDPGAGSSADPAAGPAGGGGDPAAGPAAGGGQGAPAALPCDAPSQEVGVTDDTLTLGGVFQLSGILPGFAQTASYGALAYAKYLNDNGGLCGRTVEYVVADDGFDASRNASQTESLIKKALSLVGGFSAADDGSAALLSNTNVLDVAIGTTQARQRVPNHYPLVSPEDVDDGPEPVLPEYKYAVENGSPKLAIVTVAAAAGRSLAKRTIESAEKAGMEVVLELEVSPTQFSYTSTARAVADSGAQMLLSLLEINGSVQLAEELARLESSVTLPFYRLGYDQAFLDQAGAAAEGVVNFTEFLPFEEDGSNEHLDAFLQYYDQVASGEAPTFQAAMSWIAMDLYAQVIRSLPGPITRDGLLAAASTLGQIDGRGFYGNFDFSSKVRPACKVVVRVADGAYRREAPGSGFYC